MNIKDYKSFPVTTGLILISGIVYLISFVLYGPTMNAYQALHLGAYNGFYVQHTHEYYRFITSNFIHFGILHIVVNCYSLYGLGAFVEKVLGRTRYLIVVGIAAVTTNGLPYLLYLHTLLCGGGGGKCTRLPHFRACVIYHCVMQCCGAILIYISG